MASHAAASRGEPLATKLGADAAEIDRQEDMRSADADVFLAREDGEEAGVAREEEREEGGAEEEEAAAAEEEAMVVCVIRLNKPPRFRTSTRWIDLVEASTPNGSRPEIAEILNCLREEK